MESTASATKFRLPEDWTGKYLLVLLKGDSLVLEGHLVENTPERVTLRTSRGTDQSFPPDKVLRAECVK